VNSKIFSFVLFVVACACNEDMDRQEVLDRFRGLGSIADPLVSIPSVGDIVSEVELTVYLVMPTDQEIVSAEPYEDDGSVAVPALGKDSVFVDASSITHQDYNEVRVGSFKATLLVPGAESLPALASLPRAQVRYGFVVKSDTDTETIVGNFVVAKPDGEELAWQVPTISVATPETDGVLDPTSMDLEARINNVNDEPLKMGWFVTSGEVSNRRALTTTWKEYDKKDQSIIATVHGKWSRGFSFQVINVVPE
jgi:hypothetical protein